MSVEKYDYVIQKSLFAQTYQDSTFLTPARIQKCLT